MRMVFAGTGDIALPTFLRLCDSDDYKPLAVVTQPDRPAGRKQVPKASAIKEAALQHGVSVLQPESINADASLDCLKELQADVMVVFAYGQILKPKLLVTPRLGCVNIHASLLPRHRGAACIQGAILAGDAVTGLTTMWMSEGLDCGDLIFQLAEPVRRRDTAGSLHDRLAMLAPELLLKTLRAITDGTAPRQIQDEQEASYAPRLSKSDGLLDWSQDAVALERRVRAMNPWPGAHTWVPNDQVPRMLKCYSAIVVRREQGVPGRIMRVDADGILVGAGQGCLLLRELQLEGRKRMPAREFFNGCLLRPGMDFGNRPVAMDE